MCGLLAVLGNNSVPFEQSSMGKALDEIRHRGPDDGSTKSWGDSFFGHRRLSIIDLSQLGTQPMTSYDNRYTIIFNGMIYNYKEIRSELKSLGCKFYTNTDTEVILIGYSVFGERISKKLRGIWAFIIRDELRKSVYVSRDHFGVKPLYYYQDDEMLIFASEIKVIQNLIPSKITVNKKNLHRYLARGWLDDNNNSMYTEIRQFPSGSDTVISLSDLKKCLHLQHFGICLLNLPQILQLKILPMSWLTQDLYSFKVMSQFHWP